MYDTIFITDQDFYYYFFSYSTFIITTGIVYHVVMTITNPPRAVYDGFLVIKRVINLILT